MTENNTIRYANNRYFFRHVDPAMRVMTAALRPGRDADEVLAWAERGDKRRADLARRG
jgi:hypothetical protein